MRIWLSDGDRRLQEENGYGRVSAALALGLVNLGHDVQFQQFPEMELVLFVCPPGKIKFGRVVPAAALVMHELEDLPEHKRHWIEILNRLDLVITPTNWNRRVWQRLGVTTPIEVIPLGVDVETYYPATGRDCVFLAVHENLGGETSRENWRETLRAYYGAFTAQDDVRLVIKTWKWKPVEFEQARLQVLAELGLSEAAAPALEVIDELLDGDRMRALYQGAWLFVKHANREGWSLPCSEAIACGRPVAASRIEPLVSHLPEQTRWFEPGDVAGLTRLLQRERDRFAASLRHSRLRDADTTTTLVELALRRLVPAGQPQAADERSAMVSV